MSIKRKNVSIAGLMALCYKHSKTYPPKEMYHLCNHDSVTIIKVPKRTKASFISAGAFSLVKHWICMSLDTNLADHLPDNPYTNEKHINRILAN